MPRLNSSVATVVLSLAPALLAAQGVVVGRVMARADSGAATAAAGATVSIVGHALSTITSTDGRFAIARVPTGSSTLRVRLLGYRVVERVIAVRDGDTTRVDVVLDAEAQRLATVRTDASAAGFDSLAAAPNVGTVRLTAAAMVGVPRVGEPDVVRVAQLLPGVVARNDFNTGLDVRGGEADQNLVLLDGHPIHNPFHLGGLFSTFMDATVGDVALLTGAFPARYGGRLSSVLDVRSRDDTRPGVHGSADVSVLATSARIGGALGGGRGTWSLAARRTYADALASAFTRNIFPYHFRDLHGRATYRLPGDVQLAITAYDGRDVLDANLAAFETDSAPSRAAEGTWAVNWGNRVLGATLTKDVGAHTTIEQRIGTSSFSTRLDLGAGSLVQRDAIRDVRAAGSMHVRGETHERSLGYEVAAYRLHYASGSSQTGTTDFDLAQRPVTGALWVEDLWRPTPRWLVQGGLRGEALSGRGWAALSPRATVKYVATPRLALTGGVGRVTQPLHSLAGDGPLRFFDIWIASDAYIPVESAWHGIVGVERRVREAGTVRVEGYVKHYDRVLDANRAEDPAVRGDEFFVAAGRSYGVDAIARWQPSVGVSGWIAYSYGVATRWRDGVRWAPGHDRRHDLDVVATWRIAEYQLGVRFGYASGSPYTPIVGGLTRRVYDPSRDHWGTGDPTVYVESLGGPRNGARYPANHRLDLDASREYRVRGTTVAPYVSIANAYNAKNVFVYLYQYSTDRPTRRAISQFPVLPSLGVRLAR